MIPKFTIFTCLVNFSLFSCHHSLTKPSSWFGAQAASPEGSLSTGQLTQSEKQKLARKIWQNECGGTTEGLTTWNAGEEFPSFGIGHFIWYPAGFQGRWHETFPEFIRYARQRGSQDIPSWVLLSSDCPFSSKAQFQAQFNGPQLSQLRTYLAKTILLQVDYIINRSRASVPKVLSAANPANRQRVARNYEKVAASAQGTYALIDYVNFKGDGTIASESYQGQGWGLLQVLEEMRDVPAGPKAAREFSNAAKRVLSRRIQNSPPARGEKRWEQGWHNRCETYAHSF